MWNSKMKEVAKLDYFLYTLDTSKLIMEDTKNYTKWTDRNGICIAVMEKIEDYNRFFIINEK